MVTYKSFKIFESEGITYFGIPEDMILAYMEKFFKMKKDIKFKHHKELIEKLGIAISLQGEIDIAVADKVETAVFEQCLGSLCPATERANWIKAVVTNDSSGNFQYVNDHVIDLNEHLSLKYRLAWIYKILSLRHEGIYYQYVNNYQRTGVKKTAIIIPRTIVDQAIERIKTFTGGKTNGAGVDLSDEIKEIAELVLIILDREQSMSMARLKSKIEINMGSNSISWQFFNQVIEALNKKQLIDKEGTTIFSKTQRE